MSDLKAQKPACPDHGSAVKGPEQVVAVPGDTALIVDSIRVHAVVLDERCNLVSEEVKSVPDKHRPISTMDAWDMKRPDGSSAETGIYYINVASERADGSRDTGYVKVGTYRDPCER